MKYELYDTVWAIYENKIKEVTVFSREERSMKRWGGRDISYGIGLPAKMPPDMCDQTFYGEGDVFSTKQDLLDSL